MPNPWMILPFGLLLATIALAPLFFPRWWGKHYPKVAYVLGASTLLYYLVGLQAYQRVQHTAIEYVQFIALIGSLFVVAGGIHITVKGEATPLANVVYLLIGAVVSNVLGTTGASMLMIRPWIRMNRYRITAHHVVFFIFIVSNVGGCLTPIGDPPLFLGYLKGIPFWWVAEHCWRIWLVGLGILLALFYVVDYRNYLKAPPRVRAELAEPSDEWRFAGLPNLFFLAMILFAVFITEPAFLREGLMLLAAIGSYLTTSKPVHKANHFNFHPIQEVAILFAGIFATMMPALDWLQANASKMGQPSPAFFYWGSGIISSALDNAPTYLAFLSAILGAFVDETIISQVQHLVQNGGVDLATVAQPIQETYLALYKYHGEHLVSKNISMEEIKIAFLLGNASLNHYILAISIGAVFFGANTYIGNGPNFMVRSIAEGRGVKMPSFGGYMLYSGAILIPVFVLVTLVFFRG